MAQKVLVIKVRDMNCEGCASKIENALKQIQGVNHVEVSLAKKRTTVFYDSALISKEIIEKAIIDAGFEVEGL